MHVVGETLTDAYEVELNLKVGSTTYQGVAYVTKLGDAFLLGLNFMQGTKCDILINESCLMLGGEHGEKIPALFKRTQNTHFQVSRVTVA